MKRKEASYRKRKQGSFATDGVAEQHGNTINDVVLPKATASKVHLLIDASQDLPLAQMVCESMNSPNYVGIAGMDSADVWIFTGDWAIVVMEPPSQGISSVSFVGRLISPLFGSPHHLVVQLVGEMAQICSNRCPTFESPRNYNFGWWYLTLLGNYTSFRESRKAILSA